MVTVYSHLLTFFSFSRQSMARAMGSNVAVFFLGFFLGGRGFVFGHHKRKEKNSVISRAQLVGVSHSCVCQCRSHRTCVVFFFSCSSPPFSFIISKHTHTHALSFSVTHTHTEQSRRSIHFSFWCRPLFILSITISSVPPSRHRHTPRFHFRTCKNTHTPRKTRRSFFLFVGSLRSLLPFGFFFWWNPWRSSFGFWFWFVCVWFGFCCVLSLFCFFSRSPCPPPDVPHSVHEKGQAWSPHF